jgi:hypothetical protein
MASCLPLDRVSQARRPEGPPSGSQRWRELLFVHFTFAPEVVRALVPKELELDLWEDRAWVGLVPFKMEDIRPRFAPFGLDFLETNVRTYVHHRGEPGVFFFSLEASSWLAVKAARLGWGLPYFHADMSTRHTGERVHYATKRRGAAPKVETSVEYSLGELLGPSKEGTLEHFLLERYLLFTAKDGRVSRGQVHHVPYPAQRATLHAFEDDLVAAAGLPRPTEAPSSVLYASGVDVKVFGPWDVK